jgi:hypothetical protein
MSEDGCVRIAPKGLSAPGIPWREWLPEVLDSHRKKEFVPWEALVQATRRARVAARDDGLPTKEEARNAESVSANHPHQ